MFRLISLITDAIQMIVAFLIVMVISVIGTVVGSAIACIFAVCAVIVLRFVHLPWEVMAPIIAIPAIAMIFIPTMAPVAIYCKVGWPAIPLISNLISRISSMRLSTSLAVLGSALGILLVMLGVVYGSLPEIIKWINQVMAG